MCTVSRALVAGWVAGVLGSDLAGSDVVGWIAAVAAALAVWIWSVRSPACASGSCSLPRSARPDHPADPTDDVRAPWSPGLGNHLPTSGRSS